MDSVRVILSAAKNLRLARHGFRLCHSERSEESASGDAVILRCAQNDTARDCLPIRLSKSIKHIVRLSLYRVGNECICLERAIFYLKWAHRRLDYGAEPSPP